METLINIQNISDAFSKYDHIEVAGAEFSPVADSVMLDTVPREEDRF
jgi:hypothetical protein